jgi:hypothetical protein
MKFSESPVIVFVRGIALLAMLIALPGIAVFWNLLPKDTGRAAAPNSAPVDFFKNANESAAPVSVFAPVVVSPFPLPSSESAHQQVSWNQSPPPSPTDFSSLELHLKTLGAKHCRLAPWGVQGELYRFSCWVASSESYSYEKHFESIGSDEVTVIRSVIADIERWKNASP